MPEGNSPIRVLIADDHRLVRQGIRALLLGAKDIKVVGEAGDGAETMELARRLQPDVILMDIEMPRLDGLEATRQLLAAGCPSRILMLSMRTDAETVRQAARAGARGYQIKNSDRDELMAAIRSIQAGRLACSPEAAPYFFPDARSDQNKGPG